MLTLRRTLFYTVIGVGQGFLFFGVNVEKADRRLKEFRQKIDAIEYIANWPLTYKEYTEVLSDCEDIIKSYGSQDEQEQISAIKLEVDKAVANKDVKRLKKFIEEISGLR